MINILKLLIKKIFNIRSNYISIGYNWSDSFKEYIQTLFYKDIQTISFLGEKNLKSFTSLFLKNVCLIPRKNEKTLIQREVLFDKKDLKMQSFILKNKIWKKYSFLFPYFNANIYFFHNGLRLLDHNRLQSFIDGKIAIDIGAYNGDSAFIFSQYNFKKVFSFELDDQNFNKLKENIKKFSLNKVRAFNYAISDKNETIRYSSNETASQSNCFGLGLASSISLDDFLKQEHDFLGGGGIGLIKMDIEGFEQNAIRGMIQTIKQYRPILLIAIYHSANDFLEIPKIIHSLDCDYLLRVIKIQPFHPTDECFLIATPLESGLLKARYI